MAKKLTDKQVAYRKQLIKRVHISQRYTNYYREDQEAYRSMLLDHFGVDSSAKMNITQLTALAKWCDYDLPELPIIRDRSKDATEKQLELMRSLWRSYAHTPTDDALRLFVKRVTKKLYIHVDKLTKEDATKCIIALKATLRGKDALPEV